MKGTLENVWDWYFAERAEGRSEEEIELQRVLNRDADTLRGLLHEEQIDALQKYEDHQNEMTRLLVSEAFSRGARFATAYMLDAMNKK